MEKTMATAAPRAMADTAHTKLTHDLIESDRVEGTNVYRSDGTKVGSIERLMIDKYSGQVAYAVMSFGGFLGLGHDHYPVPWAKLDYNPNLGGYEVNITDEELKAAPHFDPGKEYSWDTVQGQKIYGHYGVPTYWA
jgi:sporulation protein YlmC with PRC-barrel domain